MTQVSVTAEAEITVVTVTLSPEEAAKIYAQEAEASAAAALASEQAAELAESNAAASAAAALASEQAAELAEGVATGAASAASASAAAALASEQAADLSESNALNSANNAAGSASAALISQQAAVSSANAAAASAAAAAQVGTSTLLTGFSVGGNTAIAATDSILQAFNKTQGQLNARAVISGTPASGQVAFWNAANTLAGDSGLFWDNTNKRLGIGTNAPSDSIEITTGRIKIGNFANGATVQANDALITQGRITAAGGYFFRNPTTNDNTGPSIRPTDGTAAAGLEFYSQNQLILRGLVLQNQAGSLWRTAVSFNTSVATGAVNQLAIEPVIGATVANTVAFRGILYNPTINNLNGGTHIAWQNTSGNMLFGTTSGNVQIGPSFADAGFRLDVNGTARVQGALTTNLTAGRVPFIGTGGLLSDSAGLTYVASANTDLFITGITGQAQLSLRDSTLASTFSILTNVGQTFISSSGSVNLRIQGAGNLAFQTTNSNTTRWTIFNDGRFEANGAQTIQTSGGNLTFATGGGVGGANGNIVLSPNGTGGVALGVASPNASAIFDITSTTRGFLPPRMTSAQRNAIASPAAGLVVYNTTDNRLSVFNGTAWVNIATI